MCGEIGSDLAVIRDRQTNSLIQSEFGRVGSLEGERETDRQTDRHTDRQTDREVCGEIGSDLAVIRDMQTNSLIQSEFGRGGSLEGERERQTDRHTDRQRGVRRDWL